MTGKRATRSRRGACLRVCRRGRSSLRASTTSAFFMRSFRRFASPSVADLRWSRHDYAMAGLAQHPQLDPRVELLPDLLLSCQHGHAHPGLPRGTRLDLGQSPALAEVTAVGEGTPDSLPGLADAPDPRAGLPGDAVER